MVYVRTLHDAALELVSNLPLKQRLVNAYSKHLEHLDGSMMPASLGEMWARLRADLTAQPTVSGESAVQATVRKLGSAELEALAGRILGLYRDAATVGALRVVEDPRRERADARAADDLPLSFLSRA
jgi:hypothetical protein